MRIRSIKPEFWRSDDINVLDVPDRLLFIGLWSYVDDNGVGQDKLSSVAADLFAGDLERDPSETFARVSRGLQNLSEAGRITRYTVDGKAFLYVNNWEKHQRIDKPNKERFPSPTSPKADIRDTLATPSRESSDWNRGTGEQGNRGTEEQSSSSEDADAPIRPDVLHLIEVMEEELKNNGAKIPSRTLRNLDAARLMLDRDRHTVAQVEAAIRWAAADEFWRSNILSMSKLREKYDQLRLAAQRQKRETKQTPAERAAQTASLGRPMLATELIGIEQ
jgi:hypothetical protein